jgi:hypothetical protein
LRERQFAGLRDYKLDSGYAQLSGALSGDRSPPALKHHQANSNIRRHMQKLMGEMNFVSE